MNALKADIEVAEKFLTAGEQVIVEDCRLTDITVTGAVLSGGWVPGNPEARAERVTHSGTEMSLQLQAKDGEYLKCVHVILRQNGNNVVAHADWVACTTADHDYGYDFEPEEKRLNLEKFPGLRLATAPEGDDWEKGYGVAKLFYRRSRPLEVEIMENTDGVQVRICACSDSLSADDLCVSLHWVKDDDSWGGWILDKKPDVLGDGWVQVDFTLCDIAKSSEDRKRTERPVCLGRFSPVVFFSRDGNFNNSYFKTELGFAITNQLVIRPSGSTLENLEMAVCALRCGYRIVKNLGKGAMGEVWEVEDINLRGPHLAMKVFKPLKADNLEGLRERFAREARVLHEISYDIMRSAIRLPRILRYVEDSQLGRPFYVMDLIVGPRGKPCSLGEMKDDKYTDIFDEEHVASWFEDVCGELAVLHRHDCFHRDIKPENILVDMDGHAVIVDFGTANVIAGDFVKDKRNDITMVGPYDREQVGTKKYWAPELLSGKPASNRSDIYALAATFWNLLFDETFEFDNYPPEQEKFTDGWGKTGVRWFKTLKPMLSPNPENRPKSVEECLAIFKGTKKAYKRVK